MVRSEGCVNTVAHAAIQATSAWRTVGMTTDHGDPRARPSLSPKKKTESLSVAGVAPWENKANNQFALKIRRTTHALGVPLFSSPTSHQKNAGSQQPASSRNGEHNRDRTQRAMPLPESELR